MSHQYAFYPGCTLHSTGVEFGRSSELVCQALGLEMVEVPDWNCCGASSAHSLDAALFLALPARNLVLAQRLGLADVAIPCAACFSRLAAADRALREDDRFRARMEAELGFAYGGQVRPRNLLDIVANDLPKARLAERVVRPLAGLKGVSYYGCLLGRPPETVGVALACTPPSGTLPFTGDFSATSQTVCPSWCMVVRAPRAVRRSAIHEGSLNRLRIRARRSARATSLTTRRRMLGSSMTNSPPGFKMRQNSISVRVWSSTW